MSFTVADIITEVREQVLDTLAPVRYSDDLLVRKVNQVLRRVSILRPDLFATHAAVTCVAGVLQSCPADSIRLMDVVSNEEGRSPKEISQDTLDLMFPSWGVGAAGLTENWMRYQRDPNRFYVYPPAVAGDTLNVVYARSPSTLTKPDTVPLTDAYMPCMIDGTCWLVESMDAEYAESGRARLFEKAFTDALTAGLTVRQLTDTDAAGVAKDGPK